VYTYPVVDQQYFLKEEHPKGFLQLKKGQSYLFTDNFKYDVRFRTENAGDIRSSYTYNAAEKRLDYTFPPMQNSMSYTLAFVAAPLNTFVNVERENRVTTIENDDYSLTITEKQASTVILDDAEKVLLEYDFATSRYNKFQEKIATGVEAVGLWWFLGGDITHLIRKGTIQEPFDLAELEGNNFTQGPLVRMEATLDDSYYQQKIGPLLYHQYPVGGQFYFKNRNVAELGIAPAKAIYVIPNYITKGIEGNDNSILGQYFPFYYALRQAYKKDYSDIATQIVNAYTDQVPELLLPIAMYGCPFFSEGIYNANVYYRLPDGQQTSAVPFWFEHTF
jgi:hypothetical protein